MSRLAGHALRNEGAAHGGDGQRLWYGDRSVGHGKCECGATSPRLDSDAARKRWHQQHKKEQS